VRLDDALSRCDPAPAGQWRGTPTSWGAHGDLSTWSGPAVAEVAFLLRRAELEVMATGSLGDRTTVRELLALQSSDWAFMLARGIAAPYARERIAGHSQALQRALAAPGDGDETALRNLAHHVTT
jgi:1,4-alpha-glucan branching enzyme